MIHREREQAGGLKAAASAAMGCAIAVCGWSLGASIYQSAILLPVPAAQAIAQAQPTDERPAFSERFEPAAALPAATSRQTIVHAALLNPTFSLGTPERFRAPVPILASTAPAPEQVVSEPLVPAMRQAALAVPLPPQRPAAAIVTASRDTASKDAAPELKVTAPAELKLKSPGAIGHDALVQKARMALMASAANSKLNVFEKLFKSVTPGPMLAYAGSDGGVTISGEDKALEPSSTDRTTAVYDITAKTVYMPDGSRLEAHSGLGQHMDKPDYANLRMRGVTPPHIYDLKAREALFHGVPALRLTPIGGEAAIHNRNGLLAHTYMLGPNGQSNGCVSFKDYYAFLRAFRNGEVKRLIVVARL
jgi:hypothetical protein